MTLVKFNNPLNKSFNGLVNELFSEFPASVGKVLGETTLQYPPVNITETNEAYSIELVTPGLEKNDFTIKLEGNVLTIGVEKTAETLNESEKVIRMEFMTRSFKRSFTLDEKADAANISAKYESGILKLSIPKKEEVKALTKEITIQ